MVFISKSFFSLYTPPRSQAAKNTPLMSKYLSPKLVVAEAWELTKDYKKQLFWYGFIPAFFGMLVGTVYVLYQIAAFRHFILQEQDTVDYGAIFQQSWEFLIADGTPTTLIIILALITLLGYFIIPVICKSALIFYISKIQKGEDMEKGVQVGLLRFLPLFEFTLLSSAASPKSFFTEASFIMRNLGTGMFRLLMPVFIVFTVFGLVALFFFAYAPQMIVLEKKGPISAVSSSAKLVFNYFSETFRLFLLIMLIELRVLLNIAIILLVPVVVVWITGLFAAFLQGFGIFLAGVSALFLISLAAVISGTLEIFSTAIWTIAFHKLTPSEEKITEL